MAALMKNWNRVRAHHLQAPWRQAALEMIRRNRPAGGWAIKAAVLFGTSSFTLTDGFGETSMLQLLACLDLVELVQEGEEPLERGVPLSAQDPSYKPHDREFLASLGVHVVEDPIGQRLMKRDVFGFVAGLLIEGEIMAQCIHLQHKLWVGNGVESIRLDDWSNRRVVDMAKDPTVTPRWPRPDDAVEHSGPHAETRWYAKEYNHCIARVWFEKAKTRRQMDAMVDADSVLEAPGSDLAREESVIADWSEFPAP
ncbi:hypothetical protein B0A55_04303 [Friedmanniomyces simplex]|uniref:SRR1-like domain-containing protein n=1 Tax=Friedmanniomyces simplex TaxID=329884 RepID=A0A4U0X9G2_9PEZI|nr:hypothetical protein B0A55_04303 [Friedmanniomyces simplex]